MPDSPPSLRLVTFGTPELQRRADGGWETVEPPGKPLALLIRLVAAGAEPVSRDALAEELWSDIPAPRARAQLRTALWHIRTRLGDGAIHADETTVGVTKTIAWDGAEFRQAIQARDYETAIAVYQGEFLANAFVSGARGFEEWVDLERRNLRGLFVAAAEAQARLLTTRGHFAEAVVLAERARRVDPFNQAAWRALLEALIGAGDTVRARVEAAELVALQNAEGLDVEPETLHLLRQAKSATPVTLGQTEDDLPEADLIGRERELAALMALFESVDRKRAVAAVVAGPPGIGKSRLLRDFARAATARRGRVVVVAAPRTNEREPYATVAHIAEHLARFRGAAGVSPAAVNVLVDLHPGLSSVFRSTDRLVATPDHRARRLALCELVRAVCDESKLAIIVDDAQWLDASSRQILDALESTCAEARLLLIYGERVAREDALARRFVLSPLTAALTESLVISIGALPSEEWARTWVRAIHRASGGVPLAVLDLLRLGIERRVVRLADQTWASGEHDELVRVTEQAAPRRARIEQLPDRAREAVLLLGVAGRSLDLPVVAGALDCAERDLREAVDLLALRGIALVDHGTVVLAHDEYGVAAREAAADAERTRLLRALAAVFVARGTADTVRAGFAYASDAGDEVAAEDAARRYVALCRATQPRRATRDIVGDLMGLGPSAGRLDVLTDHLDAPGRRVRRVIGAVVALGAVAVLGRGVLTALRGDRRALSPPDAELVIGVSDSAGVTEIVRTPIRLDGWRAGTPIEVPVRRGVPLRHPLPLYAVESPTTPGRWVGVRAHEPPFLDDVILVEPDGRERSVAPAGGDDIQPVWSPDGRRVAFITARWTGREWGDIAIVDVATDSVTRVTSGQGGYMRVAFNWDGSGIAYLRQTPSGQHDVCTLVLTTRRERCRSLGPGRMPGANLDWIDPTTVRFSYDLATRRLTAFATWDLGTDAEVPLASCSGSELRGSPLVAVATCVTPGNAAVTITPIGRPGEWRPIRLVGLNGRQVAFMQVASPPGYSARLHRMHIVANADAVAGVPHALRAEAMRADSGMAPVEPAWQVLQGRAEIGPDGVLVAAEPGEVTVSARLGDLADTTRLRVHPPTSTMVLDEQWNSSWLSRWRRFGIPYPQVIRDTIGRAFWNAGDGNYFSGAYTRDTFDFSRGLAADFDLETPITRKGEQQVDVRIVGDAAPQRRLAWDHRTGWPIVGGLTDCSVEYPVGPEGSGWGTSIRILSQRPAPSAIRGGRYELRLQLFPDGRCGVAVNGKVEGVSVEPSPVTPVRITTYGSSVGTKVLVRRITVRSGVPDDISWPPPLAPKPGAGVSATSSRPAPRNAGSTRQP